MSKLAQSIDTYETFQRISIVLATNYPYDPVVYLNNAQAKSTDGVSQEINPVIITTCTVSSYSAISL